LKETFWKEDPSLILGGAKMKLFLGVINFVL